MAVAVTGGADHSLRIVARRLCTATVVRARQNHVELAFEHGLQKPIAKTRFDRIKPVVEKMDSRVGLGLRRIRLRGKRVVSSAEMTGVERRGTGQASSRSWMACD